MKKNFSKINNKKERDVIIENITSANIFRTEVK